MNRIGSFALPRDGALLAVPADETPIVHTESVGSKGLALELARASLPTAGLDRLLVSDILDELVDCGVQRVSA